MGNKPLTHKRPAPSSPGSSRSSSVDPVHEVRRSQTIADPGYARISQTPSPNAMIYGMRGKKVGPLPGPSAQEVKQKQQAENKKKNDLQLWNQQKEEKRVEMRADELMVQFYLLLDEFHPKYVAQRLHATTESTSNTESNQTSSSTSSSTESSKHKKEKKVKKKVSPSNTESNPIPESDLDEKKAFKPLMTSTYEFMPPVPADDNTGKKNKSRSASFDHLKDVLPVQNNNQKQPRRKGGKKKQENLTPNLVDEDQEIDDVIFAVEKCNYNHVYDEYSTLFMSSGKHISKLPSCMWIMPWLTELNLAHNNLTLLPAELGNLVSLEKLIISNNELVSLPEEISQLKNLRTLLVFKNQLSFLPSGIAELTKLEIIDAAWNRLRALPFGMGRLQKLFTLVLNNNKISLIPYELGQIKTFDRININLNPIINVPPEVYQYGTEQLLEHLRKEAPTTVGKKKLKLFLEPPHHFSDVTFIVNKQRFPAHKVILSTRSAGFLALFSSHPDQKEFEVNIKVDEKNSVTLIPASTFQLFLRYFYEDYEFASGLLNKLFSDRNLQEQFLSLTELYPTKELTELVLQAMGRRTHLDPNTSANLTFSPSHPFHDAEFLISGQRFPAHKILFARSGDYFMTMFTGRMIEAATNLVKLPISIPSFLALQEYCYTEVMSENAELLGGENLIELIQISDEYNLLEFKQILESIAGYAIDAENVLYLYSVSQLYKCKTIESACICALSVSKRDVTKDTDFQIMTKDMQDQLLTRLNQLKKNELSSK